MSAVGLRQVLTNQQNKPIPDPWGLKPAKNWGQRPWLRTRWGHGRGHRLNDARWSADEVRAPLATKREEGSSRIWCLKTVDPLLKFCYLLLGNPLQWNQFEIMKFLNESNKLALNSNVQSLTLCASLRINLFAVIWKISFLPIQRWNRFHLARIVPGPFQTTKTSSPATSYC